LAARTVADKRAYFTTGKNPEAFEDDPWSGSSGLPLRKLKGLPSRGHPL